MELCRICFCRWRQGRDGVFQNYVTASVPLFVDSVFDVEYDSSIIGEGYEAVAEEAFSRGVASAVADEFSLDEKNLRVELYGFDFENMKAERIRVILSGRAALADYKGIEKYVNGLDIGVCECEIEIG